MYLLQSSSLKLLCALVVPAVLANALPQSLDNMKRQSRNKTLTLHGNKEGDMNAEVQVYPQVELTDSPGFTDEFGIVGRWTGDGNNKSARAYREIEENWSNLVSMWKGSGQLLAAGKDDEQPPQWWIILDVGGGIGFDGERLEQ